VRSPTGASSVRAGPTADVRATPSALTSIGAEREESITSDRLEAAVGFVPANVSAVEGAETTGCEVGGDEPVAVARLDTVVFMVDVPVAVAAPVRPDVVEESVPNRPVTEI
jgi:hypothetical protein